MNFTLSSVRKSRAALYAVFLVSVLAFLCPACGRPIASTPEKEAPRLPPGEKILVWDMNQPHFPGCRPYEEEVQRVCQEFEKNTGIQVEVAFISRSEVSGMLKTAGETSKIPDVLFSGEFPSLTGLERDLSDLLTPSQYQDVALGAWTRAGRILGIPSAILWVGTAVREDALDPQPGDAGQPPATASALSSLTKSLGVIPSSEPFMEVATRGPSGRYRTPQEIAAFVSWVKANFAKSSSEPCLERFKRGEVQGIYCVTPYLFKWLRISSQPGDGAQPVLLPLIFESGDMRFTFTVPGYVVLSQSESKLRASVELGKLLAENYGRWAARALGLVPAKIEDLPVFTVESGFTAMERAELLAILNQTATSVSPEGRSEFPGEVLDPLSRYQQFENLSEVFAGYFSTGLTEDDLVREITSALQGNTSP